MIEDSFEIALPSVDRTAEQRIHEAKKAFKELQENGRKSYWGTGGLIQPLRGVRQEDREGVRDREGGEQEDSEEKYLKDAQSLLILQQLSLGKNMTQIYHENQAIQALPKERLKNIPQLTLLRLSKILLELLPISVPLTPKQFFEKYFRTNEMLRFYRSHGLNLSSTFEGLLYISNWRRVNNEYLSRGYSRDFVHEEVKQRLAGIPQVYERIVEIHENHGHELKTREKRKASKRSSPSPSAPSFRDQGTSCYEQ